MYSNYRRRLNRNRWTSLLFFALLFSSSSKQTKKDSLIHTFYSHSDSLQTAQIKTNAAKEKDMPYIEPILVYLNPSVQTWNPYINHLGTEAEHMNEIAKMMYTKLNQYSFIQVEANLNYLPLKDSVRKSNEKKREIHLALHSNAGGGSGLETFQKKNDGFGNYMHQYLAELLPFNSRGVKDGNHLYEVKNAKAEHVVLMEILFHDRLDEANYIVSHHEEIATTLTNALVSYIRENYEKK